MMETASWEQEDIGLGLMENFLNTSAVSSWELLAAYVCTRLCFALQMQHTALVRG